MMVDNWKAGAYLGIITAGALWIGLFKEVHFEANMPRLITQIHKVLAANSEQMAEFAGADEDDDGEFTFDEVRAELSRLKVAISSDSENAPTSATSSKRLGSAVSILCELPAAVPLMPSGLRVTDEMHALETALLSPSSASQIGFYGMGVR
jgi:hypothetical protein